MSKVIKQHNDASYSKEQNNVEKYLMKIIQRYFLVEQEYTEGQKEAIIVEAIRRIKIYLAEHRAGVFALNNKTGIVHLDITDFDGEPEFEKKNSFNKDFGTSEDTICQGNDSRLSDKREPLEHTHYIDEIDGLEEALQERYSINIIGHEHNDKEVLDKIIYTGSSPEVDLILLEQFLDMVSMFITQLKLIQINTEDVHNKFKDFLSDVEVRIDSMRDIYAEFMKEQTWLVDAKQYADEQKDAFVEMCRQKLRAYMTDEEFKDLIKDLNFVDSINGYLDFTPEEEVKKSIIDERIVTSFDIGAVVYDDHSLRPVQGIAVQLDNGETVITDSNGHYSFTDVSKGEHVLTFTKSNYYTTQMYIFLNDTSTAIIEDVYIVPIMVTLTVTVKGTSDEPLLAGAIVKLSELDLTGITGEDGTCEFKVYQNRTYTLTASCADYIDSSNVSVASHETDFAATITLEPIMHTLTVCAVDIATNMNIERTDTTVRVVGVGVTADTTKNTNANGTAQFTVRQNRDYRISISNKRYLPYDDTDIHIGNEDITKVLKLTRKTINLKVYVKGASDEPVLAGSTVIFNGTSYTTDSNGMCEIAVPNYETHTVTAKYTDYNDNSISVNVDDADKTATITLTPITHILTVNVADIATNRNIEDTETTVQIAGVGITANETKNTNASGVVQFTVRQNRNYKVSISNKKYLPYESSEIHIGNTDNTQTFKLTRKTVTLKVYVKGSPSDEPVLAGSTIVMNGTSYTTDSNGMYELTVPNYESFSITAKYADYNDKTATVTVEGTDKTATITLDPIMHNLMVNVKEMYTNNNISGANVNIVINGQTVGRTATTDNDGNVTFEVRQNRAYKLKVTKSNYIASEEYTIPGRTSDGTFNVTLKHNPVTITFTVMSEESSPYNRVSGAIISISDDSNTYTTNENGQITASVDPYKEYTFTATLPVSANYPNDEYTTRTLTATKTISTASNVTQNFTFTAARYNINITVKDENGNVISGQPVKINDDTVNTSSSGIATINVRGKRLYLVSISRTGYNSVINEMINLGTSDFDKTINLTLVETKLTIKVKDGVNNNALMSGVTIKVKNVTDNTEEETVGSTNSDGELVITLKGGKTYKITASKSGYSDNASNYTTGTTTTSAGKLITMQLANHIKGKVLNTRTNGGISGVTVKITGTSYTAQTNDDGEYDITGVAAGTYSFEFTKEGFESDTTSLTNIVIQAGQDKTNVDVSLTPVLASNQYEFHLSWNEPSDIDLHANGSFTDTNYNSNQYYHVGYDSNGSTHTFSYGGSSISWDTDAHGSDGTNENITLTLVKGSAYFYVVNWTGNRTSFNWTLKGGDGTYKSGSYTFYGNGTSTNKEMKGICTVYNYVDGNSGVTVH